MVAEPWIRKVRAHVGSTAAAAMKKESKPPPDPDPSAKRGGDCIGILSFEVASAMSKAAHLHRSLSASEVARLRGDVLRSHAVRTLVSPDEARLLELVVAEKLDDLGRVAAVVSRLGKRCTEPALVGFEHVYADLLTGRAEAAKLQGLLAKDMEGTVKKMERYVSSTSSLYAELEVLNELEQGAKKLYPTLQQHEETRRAYEQKIQWQRHDVKHLRDVSLWNQTHDKVVGLMARAVCTIYARLRLVFGESLLTPASPPEVSRQLSVRRRPPCSGPLQPDASQSRSGPAAPTTRGRRPGTGTPRGGSLGFPCGSAPVRHFVECLSLSSSAPLEDDDGDGHFDRGSCPSRAGTSGDPRRRHKPGRTRQRGVASLAAPSTVGGSALALHYANVIIVIEKLLRYPHLVGEEARDELYQMLPTSLRSSLRRSLRSYVKELAIYDAPLAHDWKERLDKTLLWLAPMAHNMIRWQTERNFEQQQIGVRANVLLLQTLYFADREKTEAAMCELLVGLNYICRYEHQQSALLDCTSSLDFDECTDWQLQY
uniref:DUF668 domain-containing protein n=1 Tax=Anthurium amnicola TaxID=1678845 RepID=A0A1D1YN98_9ARAE